MSELQEFIDNVMECEAINVQTIVEEAIIGTPGPDGEDPLRNWKPLGIFNALGGIRNGEYTQE